MAETAESIRVDEFVTDHLGGREIRAIVLSELASAAEAAHDELKYDPEPPYPSEVMDAIKVLAEYEFYV